MRRGVERARTTPRPARAGGPAPAPGVSAWVRRRVAAAFAPVCAIGLRGLRTHGARSGAQPSHHTRARPRRRATGRRARRWSWRPRPRHP